MKESRLQTQGSRADFLTTPGQILGVVEKSIRTLDAYFELPEPLFELAAGGPTSGGSSPVNDFRNSCKSS
ncbi:MAG: hypothetical protein LAO22_22085, partial [Acidobacteriia bacterium]|nr:hypothetical protein [Terriglobia bacterium]